MNVFINLFEKLDMSEYDDNLSDDSDDDIVLSSNSIQDNNLNTTYNHLIGNTPIEPITIVVELCCLCGKEYHQHMDLTHKFFIIKDEYKCKKCGLYFYQHKHSSKHCNFTPCKNIN